MSFARIFYRNALNNGLPALTCADAVEALATGDAVEIDLGTGTICCAAGTFTFPELPESALSIIEAGGLIPFLRRRLGAAH